MSLNLSPTGIYNKIRKELSNFKKAIETRIDIKFNGDTKMFAAIKNGDVNEIERLIKANYNHKGKNLLIAAVKYNQLACVEKLLELGVNIHETSSFGETALFKCVSDCEFNRDILEALLKRGALSYQGRTRMGFIPPIMLMYQDNIDALKLMYHYDKNIINAKDDYNTMLSISAQRLAFQCAKWLLEMEIDPNTADPLGNTPAMLLLNAFFGNEKGSIFSHFSASSENNSNLAFQILELLILHNAKVNIVAENKNTFLHAAARWGKADLIPKLHQAGVCLNQLNQNGESAVMLAAERDHSDTYRALKGLGAQIPAYLESYRFISAKPKLEKQPASKVIKRKSSAGKMR